MTGLPHETQLSNCAINASFHVPRGLFSSAADTANGRTVLDQMNGDFSQQREIVPSMLVADAGSIFLKRDIQHPMQTVFNQPVLTDGGDLPLIFDLANWTEKTAFLP